MPGDNNHETNAKTLAEALKMESVPFRDKALALEPMPNYSSTPGTETGVPLTFWGAYNLADRPRRIALLLDDCQEEYRPYAKDILPNLEKLVTSFRKRKEQSEGVCVFWSAWARSFDDEISNSMDRWYGPRGLRPEQPENAIYIHGGKEGMKPLKEICPTEEEIKDGWFAYSRHLDMFWNFRPSDGKSYLDEKLKELGIDTVIVSGLWTDECILSTTFAASSRGYDVVIVSDGTATATGEHDAALKVAKGTVAKILTTEEIVSYMDNDFVMGEIGAVKGTTHADGRKEKK